MKALLTALPILFPVLAIAADINCKGKVTWVMDYPQQCSGNTAFKTSGSDGQWICPPSDNGNAIVLAALTADKSVEVYIDSKNGSISCSSLPNYVSAKYIIINP
ncbi:hypothetical protein [Pseudoalteromonas rubra]|uniref:Secreted protein n=1 Tax=Pseudoalteromonas rubra TaxID=43658 RepID=A0A0F4QAY9_9GAMM|nr:hypothetical protein [Pseudoalteromonas rubra]KJZ04469.1 hypothetical protein TW77_23500 [Pseudoalteromonas rubra]